MASTLSEEEREGKETEKKKSQLVPPIEEEDAKTH
jgi:hypothetical protein